MSYVYLLHLPNYGYAQFFGPKPQLVYCPRCKQNRTTKLEFVTGKGSWSCCILIGIFGGSYGFIGIIALIDAIIKPETTEGSRASRIFLICIFLCLWFCMCCCCMFGSFYCDRFKDVEHYCSVCDTYIGKYERNSRRPIVILPPELYKNLPTQE
uniref:LITAF domain-containing protein n=1 Tax=Meloidogyne enterolobii TaxID=390850 RepID=A0A6V7VLC1_MELEN|nr:unnamed protein product [Meloidogyne enterolobii]